MSVELQNIRTEEFFAPQSVASTATATGNVDTQGYDYCSVLMHVGTAATNPIVITLGDGPTTSAFTDIPALIGDDTSTGFTIPAADTSNSQIMQLNIDCREIERFVQLEFTPGATQLVDAIAVMSRAHEAPVNTTLKNQTLFVNA